MADLASVELTRFTEEAKQAARGLIELGVSATKAEKVTSDFTGEILRIKKVFDDLYPITSRTKEQWELYNRALDTANANHKTTVASMGALGTAIDHTQKRQNKLGTAFNQASFQVNDFFVQISSGTDAMVALGQQGSQLAQILTMFGGKLAVVGAVASVLVPIVTSIARSLDLFGDAATSAMKRAETSSNKILESFEKIREAADLTGAVSGLSNLAEVLDTRVLMSVKATGEELKKQFGRDEGGFWQFLNRVQQTGLAFTTGGFEGAAAQKLKMMGLEAKEAGLWIERALVASERQLDVLSETLLMRKSVGVIQDKEFNLLVNIAAKRAEELASIRKNRSALKEKVDLTFLELMYGKDSVEIREHENFLAKEALKAKLKSANASDDEIKRQLEMLRVQQETVRKIKEKEEAEKAAKKAQEAALKSAKEVARIRAETLGFEIQALKKQQLTSDTYNDIVEKEIERYKLQKGITEEMAKEAVYAEAIAAKTTAVKASLAGTRSGGKVSEKEAKVPDFDKLVDKNKDLVELIKAQLDYGKDSVEYKRTEFDIEMSRYKLSKSQTQELWNQKSAIESVLDTMRRVEEAQKAIKDAAGVAGAEIGRSLATGDEMNLDKLLRDILILFLQIEAATYAFTTGLTLLGVPQKIAGQIAGTLVEASIGYLKSFANGGVFDQGVQKFADGGVVTRPTLFPMSSGVGLMGEAGPEAIMPLKRGRDGKLGVAANDNQGVQVTQVFNFSANGDESVKKIIAEEAPKLSRMASYNMTNDLRRRRV